MTIIYFKYNQILVYNIIRPLQDYLNLLDDMLDIALQPQSHICKITVPTMHIYTKLFQKFQEFTKHRKNCWRKSQKGDAMKQDGALCLTLNLCVHWKPNWLSQVK